MQSMIERLRCQPTAPGRVKLVDIEIGEPLRDLSDLEGYVAAQALVRLHGRPVGYVVLPVHGGECPTGVVRERIAAKLGDAVLAARIERSLSAEPQPDLPSISIAVCTRDRTDRLKDCLPSLRALDYPDLEVLVVDNAPSDDATRRLVEDSYPDFRYVREPRPGLDIARNRAVLEARGEIIAFTDDDCVVDRLWARSLGQLFASSPEVDAVTGLVVPLELETEAQRLFELYGGFGRGFKRRWYRAEPGPGPIERHLAGTGEFGTGANMAYRRDLFRSIGGFDPALDVGTATNGGGDLDMFFRVVKEGGCLVYEPRAIVRHRHRRDYAALRTQLANNGVGFYSYLVRNFIVYPDERWRLARLAIWWFWKWSLRRLLLTFIRPRRLPRDLVLVELRGSLRGLRAYQAARRAAREEEAPSQEPAAWIAADRVGNGVAAPTGATAVRVVDVSRTLKPLDDLNGASAVKVYLAADGDLRGYVQIDCYGRSVSVPRLRDAIVDRLSSDLKFAFTLSGVLSFSDTFTRRLIPSSGAERLEDPTASQPRLPREVPVTIVIATHDRPDDLRACLASLRSQRTDRELDIIVVDNHPASGLTAPTLRDFPGVRLIEESRGGASYARNAGFAASRHEIIVSVDDDVVAPPDWLERLIAPLARNDVMIVSGNVLPLELRTRAQRTFETYGGLGRGFERWEANRHWFDSYRGKAVPTWELGATANAALRSSILHDPDIGFLCEELGPGSPSGCSEDTLLFYRVLKKGHTIVYEPSAFVWHRHRAEPAALRRQIYDYSKGHVAYHLLTLFQDRDLRALRRLLVSLPRIHALRVINRLLGRTDYPLSLLALEIAGNAIGPWALLRSRLRVRRLGRVVTDRRLDAAPDEAIVEGSAVSTS